MYRPLPQSLPWNTCLLILWCPGLAGYLRAFHLSIFKQGFSESDSSINGSLQRAGSNGSSIVWHSFLGWVVSFGHCFISRVFGSALHLGFGSAQQLGPGSTRHLGFGFRLQIRFSMLFLPRSGTVITHRGFWDSFVVQEHRWERQGIHAYFLQGMISGTGFWFGTATNSSSGYNLHIRSGYSNLLQFYYKYRLLKTWLSNYKSVLVILNGKFRVCNSYELGIFLRPQELETRG